MVKKGSFLVLLTVFLLMFSSIVYAVQLDIKVTPVKDTVFKGEEAKFNIGITNEESVTDTFKVSSLNLNWILNKEATDLVIGAGKTENYLLVFEPLGALKPGRCGIVLTVSSKTKEEIELEKVLEITLVDETSLVSSEITSSDSIDPRRESSLKLQVSNNYNLLLEDVKIKMSSGLFEREETFDLEPFGEEETSFSIAFGSDIQDGDYSVDLLAYQDEKLIGKDKSKITVSKYPGIREVVTPENGILTDKVTVEKINEGNSIERVEYGKELGWFAKLFTSSDPAPTTIVKTEEGYLMKWEFEISPKETKTISIKTSYTCFVLSLIVLILVIAGLYELLRREVVVNKKLLTKLRTKDNVAKIKVIIEVKNQSRKEFKNLKLMDRIPNGSKAGEYGTLTPERTIKGLTTLSLMWKIPALRGGEDRIMSYSVEIPLRKGRIGLPPALLKYNRGNRSLVSKSKQISFYLK